MAWAQVISNVITNIVGVSQMTVCSSPDLEALRLLRRTENSTSNGTDTGERSFKLVGSASHDHDFCCPPVVDSATWLSVIGGLAIVTFFLRMQIINIIGRKRRKREETTFWLADLLETVDREQFDINHDGDSQSGTTSWLLRLLTDTDQGQPAPEVDSCLRRTWRCVSGSVEDLLHHLDDKELSVISVVQSVLARMVFHGAQNSMWMSVMRIPQARSLLQCISSHDQCVAHNVLSKEAHRQHLSSRTL